MKKLFTIFLLFLFITVYVGIVCAETPVTDERMPGPEVGMPKADAADVWNYITKKNPYKKWGFWPDHQGLQPGWAPHGALNKVYVNDLALKSKSVPVQYGAMQVKENFNKEGELKAITVMYKVNGYNPEDGDWFWVKYTADGQADPVGKSGGCVGCHGTRAKNDFILVHEFN